MYKGDMVNKFESFMDVYRAFDIGDSFHDQLFRLHSPVEIIENDGNRSNFECLACQVIWPCHTYTILEAWARNVVRSQPVTKKEDTEKSASRMIHDYHITRTRTGSGQAVGRADNISVHYFAPDDSGITCRKCNLPHANPVHTYGPESD